MIDSGIKITLSESPKHVTGHNSIYIEYLLPEYSK